MEKVVGILKGVQGHTFDTLYDLVFTTERVIAVIIQHPTDFSSIPGTKQSFVQLLAGGLIPRGEEQSRKGRIAKDRRQAIQEKPLDELIQIHPQNFNIYYDAITCTEITRGLFKSPQLKFHLSESSEAKRDIRVTLTKENLAEAQHLIELVLPSKVKGR